MSISRRTFRSSPVASVALSLLALVWLGCAAGCGGNNIGALWDPDPGGGGGQTSTIVVVPEGGRIVDRRPTVEDAFPSSGGWPASVPIVVVFSESMSEETVTATAGGGGGIPGFPGSGGGGGDPTVYIRVEGTEQPLPGINDLIWGGRAVVIRPAAELSAEASYEICVDPEARDVDGVRYGGTEVDVVGTFRADRAETIEDGRIVTTLPVDNGRDVRRSSELFVIFDTPPNVATVNTASLRVETNAGLVSGNLDEPLEITQGTTDPRVYRFTPSTTLDGSVEHRVIVDETITFGTSGVLDFDGRVPFSRFDTVGHAPPLSVSIGNAPMGFPDKINASNVANATVDVEVDASVPARARIQVRVYGLDPNTEPTDDLTFVELTGETMTAGPTTVSLPLGPELGVPGNYAFDEGALSLRAEVIVSGDTSGFAASATTSSPEFDVTRPTIDALLPAQGGSSTDVATDLEWVVVHGRASEQLGDGEITAAGMTVPLFASGTDGRFLFEPLQVGTGLDGIDYTLTVTDAAGNSTAMPVSGRIVPRGAVFGSLGQTGRIVVYDEVTLEPVVGATVVVERGLPQKPAVFQTSSQTGATGQVQFLGSMLEPHTVTVVADGYELITLVYAMREFASIPLRPIAADRATASLEATTAFVATGGQTALLGANTIVDPALEAVASGASNPTVPPATPVRAGRPLVLTAFSGTLPPTAPPVFANYACEMCGVDLRTPTPPTFGPAGGDTLDPTIALLPATGSIVDIAGSYNLDFAASAGLGTLDGEPTVRVVGSLRGFAGSFVAGVGYATSVAGAEYAIRAGHALPIFLGLQDLGPTLWISTQVADQNGAVVRHRRLITDPQLGLALQTTAVPGVPVITAPAGPSAGSPAVEFQDVADPAAIIAGGQVFTTIRAVDPNGRAWRMIWIDDTAAGGTTTLQFPDLGSVPATGLATGAWEITVANELSFSLTATPSSFVLAERHRDQVTWARSAPVTFTVQ